LHSVSKANAHFSNDVLSSLLNEPIPGQGAFWSSAQRKSYPISVRIRSFSQLYPIADPKRDKEAPQTFAASLIQEFGALVPADVDKRDVPTKGANQLTRDDFGEVVSIRVPIPPSDEEGTEGDETEVDVKSRFEGSAIAKFRTSDLVKQLSDGSGVAWGSVKAFLKGTLPERLDDRDTIAYQLVKKAMETIFGEQNHAWHSFRDERGITQLKTGARPKGST
jgi:hypothetical protein